MDLNVLNTDFEIQNVIDIYRSFIWADRYSASGDFELYLPMSSTILDVCRQGYYLQFNNSERMMIIENLELVSDVESGTFLTITGNSLESILLRRIIWEQTNLSNGIYVENAIKRLLDDAIINPSIANRKIPNFIFKYSEDSRISSLKTTGELQFTGDVLYDAIKKICDIYDLGFKITLNESKQLVFELFMGLDRSYSQTTLPYVAFSPSFDNLIGSDYKLNIDNYRNVTLVAGEGEGKDRRTVVVDDGSYSGLARRELYTDARDLSSNTDDGTLTDEQYKAVLTNRGIAKLSEKRVESDFSANVDYTQMYKYGEDYFMGDIVQFENEFGLRYKVRITEFIQSDSEGSGFEQYPTFEILEEE